MQSDSCALIDQMNGGIESLSLRGIKLTEAREVGKLSHYHAVRITRPHLQDSQDQRWQKSFRNNK